MKSSLHKYCFSVILLLVSPMLFQEQAVKDELIEKALDERVAEYIKLQDVKCKEKAIKSAGTNVDSLISYELGAGPIDTLDFPNKPSKPQFESYDSLLKDTVPLVPLLDSINLDSSSDSIR